MDVATLSGAAQEAEAVEHAAASSVLGFDIRPSVCHGLVFNPPHHHLEQRLPLTFLAFS